LTLPRQACWTGSPRCATAIEAPIRSGSSVCR
jgi:hypothetical protein